MVQNAIAKLVQYGLSTELIGKEDAVWAANRLLKLLSLDELSEEAEDILSFIPDKNTAADSIHLNDGVFIILTSRCADEEGLSKKSREIIDQFANKADAVIKIKRDDKNYLGYGI